MLRYRTSEPTSESRKFLSYSRIAAILNLTHAEVEHICRKALNTPTALSDGKRVRKLDQEHLDFLLNQRTLEQWSGLTLQERTVRFHRVYTDKRIAVTSLRRLYLKNGIKRKKIRHEKPPPDEVRPHYKEDCVTALRELTEAKAAGRLLIYLDEINFTKRSLLTREWSSKNTNLTVDQENVYTGYRSVIAAITEERGVNLIRIQEQAGNAEDFLVYLKALRAKYGKRPITLFMDRLNVHKANSLKPWYPNLDITPCFNARYSPETNPIEAVFSKVKAIFSRKRVNCLVNRMAFDMDNEIRAAFRTITPEHCAACVRKSLHLL